MKNHRYRVKAQEVTTHTFTINAPEKDDAEEINDHFSSREVKGTRKRTYEQEEYDG